VRIDSIDMFYLALPEVRDIGDGSQDMVLVRVRAGGFTGWGECEASPLPTIAALVTPASHSACRPVGESVLGQALDGPDDIARIGRLVGERSLDLLQAAHTWSGIEIALWDLLGKVREVPVFELLGQRRAVPKTPYASQLFGDDPAQTLEKARSSAAAGYRAVKMGWGPYGRGTVAEDADHVHAAREGLGPDGILLVDAGTVWGDDVEAAAARLPALQQVGAVWLEEPFVSGALSSYAALARLSGGIGLAAGEGAHQASMAEHLIDHGGIRFVQIDAGRIGGIGPAESVARYAASRDVQYVNHTFTSHLALSASLQPYAGSADSWICEYPVELSSLASGLAREPIALDSDGCIRAPAAPGLGVELDLEAVRPYLQDVEIVVGGRVLYRTPELVEGTS
jgi:L-alanine-DL-glutamate epimerase-like enolase superfamily enzyme